jgi:hypothetical protein
MSDMTCEQLDELGAEMALGVLPAFERAMAQGHLAGCARCRDRVRQFTAITDGLLELVPESEPPVGLESRVMRGLQPTPIRRERRRWPRVVLAAACAVLIALGSWAVGSTAHDSATQLVSATLTTPTHSQVGTIYVYKGSPGWTYMKVDVETGDEWVSCQMERRDGTYVTGGTFQMHGGYGFWGGPLTVAVSDIAGARIVTADGRTIATASF